MSYVDPILTSIKDDYNIYFYSAQGAYGAIMDDETAADQFCEEDIDQILQRRTQVVTIDSGVKGSTFAKATFATAGTRDDIALDDPDFWEKWAKKVNLSQSLFVFSISHSAPETSIPVVQTSGNKAVYTTASVAYGWAGALMEVRSLFGLISHSSISWYQ